MTLSEQLKKRCVRLKIPLDKNSMEYRKMKPWIMWIWVNFLYKRGFK
jgi:hypothetical protein